MHGTYLGNDKVNSDKPQLLIPGDELVFGIPVYRNQRTFQPAKVKVGIEFREASVSTYYTFSHQAYLLTLLYRSRSTTSPSRIFTVPDDCSTDDNEPMDEDVPRVESGPDHEENPWQQDALLAPTSLPQVDGFVDLVSTPSDTSPPSSPIYDEANYTIPDDSISNHSERDNDSIHLTEPEFSDSEYSSHTPPSPIGAEDLRNPAHTTYYEDDSASVSWNSVSSDSGEDTDENPSEQEGLFIYDTEDSDELDDSFDPVDGSFDPEMQEPMQPADLPLQAPRQAPGRHSLPPINEALAWNQWGPGPNGFAPYYMNEPRREPSPTDAVLPHSHRRLGAEELEPPREGSSVDATLPTSGAVNGCAELDRVTTEALGQKSGKTAFFEAREHNKVTIAGLMEEATPWGPTDVGGHAAVCDRYMDSQPTPGAKTGMDSQSPMKHKITFPPFTAGDNRTLRYPSPGVKIPNPNDFRLQSPSEDSRRTTAFNDFDPSDWFPSSAYELQQLKQQQTEWTVGPSRSTFNDNEIKGCFGHTPDEEAPMCMISITERVPALPTKDTSPAVEPEMTHREVTGIQKDTKGKRKATEMLEVHENDKAKRKSAKISEMREVSKRKRKAEGISDATEDEINNFCRIDNLALEENGQNGTYRHTVGSLDASTPPRQTSIPPNNTQSSLPSPPNTPDEEANPESRSNKRLKRIAERVGYAALGGATVGAMVLTSLIYTAPSFV